MSLVYLGCCFAFSLWTHKTKTERIWLPCLYWHTTKLELKSTSSKWAVQTVYLVHPATQMDIIHRNINTCACAQETLAFPLQQLFCHVALSFSVINIKGWSMQSMQDQWYHSWTLAAKDACIILYQSALSLVLPIWREVLVIRGLDGYLAIYTSWHYMPHCGLCIDAITGFCIWCIPWFCW